MSEQILSDKTTKVPVESLTLYDKNPRKGNIPVIVDSLSTHGQYRPLIVRKDTNEVLAGNHTLQAAMQLGWKTIAVNLIDVDDEQAAKIVLVDNRSQDLATYDQKMLGEILADVPDLPGTGYDQETVDLILDAITNDQQVDFAELAKPPILDGDDVPFENQQFGEEDNSINPGEESPEEGEVTESTLENAAQELSGAFQLKEDAIFDGVGYWGIPRLRPDMLMAPDEIPANLLAWAGSATKDWPDEDQWWLYNFGIDSTSGMKDISKIVLGFYCWDEYFENWWNFPERYVTKLLNSRIKYAITPDFSMFNNSPRIVSIWSHYQNMWIGRFMQEAGIRVIPNVSWRGDDVSYLKDIILATLPQPCPVIAMQAHTGIFDENDKRGDKKLLDKYGDAVRLVYETLKPEMLLLYAGSPGRKYIEGLKLPWDIFFVEHRLTKLAAQASGRTKKTTL
jgi:hypothetical protein